MQNCQFTNFCFREVFSKIHLLENKSKVFIYSDPPYIHMTDKRPYGGLVFTKNDFIDLLDTMQNTQCNFAISEFENEFIFEEIEKRKLNIITIGERKNIKNRKTEILITNYKLNNTLFQ